MNGKKASMNKQEFAAYVGVSLRTLEALMHDREVSFVRIRGRVLFTERHAEELFKKFDVPAVGNRRKGLKVAASDADRG
jgi:excisionase family DNA binding protein